MRAFLGVRASTVQWTVRIATEIATAVIFYDIRVVSTYVVGGYMENAHQGSSRFSGGLRGNGSGNWKEV